MPKGRRGKKEKSVPSPSVPFEQPKSRWDLYSLVLGIALTLLLAVVPRTETWRAACWLGILFCFEFVVCHCDSKFLTRKLRIVAFVIVFGAVALGAWSSWPKTIVISPSDFTFSENGWWNTTTIALTNASDKPKYSVWVEIWSDDPKVDPMKDIKWSVDDNPDAIKLGVGASAVLNTDVIGLLTTEPHRAILLRFYEVVPGRTRHTVVTGMMKTKSNGKAQIRGFKDEPEPLIGR